MAFHKSNLGSFGGGIRADMNGYVPEATDGPFDLSVDHGTERTHDDDGNLTEYGEWWRDEGFPAWRDEAVAATAKAEAALAKWQSRTPDPPSSKETTVTKQIRTRDDGVLEGVHGPLFPCAHDRKSIAGRMGWQDNGEAANVITRTLDMLGEGKAVRLKSHLGVCYFQPLADDEDGRNIPKSRAVVYDGEGDVVERTVTQTVRVRLLHNSSIPNARWCEPVGWEPSNVVEGSELVDGAWWNDDEQTAGLVWFGHPNEYGANEVMEAKLDDLRVASCGDCHVIGKVKL